jgi:hypothetical protein
MKKKYETEFNMLFVLDNILRLPMEDLDLWCERYEVTPFDGVCDRCQEVVKVCIPFACGNFRGLVSDACLCGNNKLPFTYVSINPNHVLNTRVFGSI